MLSSAAAVPSHFSRAGIRIGLFMSNAAKLNPTYFSDWAYRTSYLVMAAFIPNGKQCHGNYGQLSSESQLPENFFLRAPVV